VSRVYPFPVLEIGSKDAILDVITVQVDFVVSLKNKPEIDNENQGNCEKYLIY